MPSSYEGGGVKATQGTAMKYDFNILERQAATFTAGGRPQDALKIYLFMANGDTSLNRGYRTGNLTARY